jgi:Secretion system C-terminal sorting domain
MKHFFLSSILVLLTTVTFSQSTSFSIYITNPSNCPYTVTGTWHDTTGVGNVIWNSVDSTTYPSMDVWSATVQSNSPTDTMIICVSPSIPCSCPMVCITLPVNPGLYTIPLCISVAINEIVKENNFLVYPNPSENQINLKADAKLLGSVYTVYDNTGKSVLSGKINSENTIIELGGLSAGIYLFSVGENMKQSFKVIKE